MSTREPMWYCHECHSEMRPLMVPDPHCASCNGTFVERIENPTDDPRDFQMTDPAHWEDGPLPAEMDVFFTGLRSILRGPNSPPPTATSSSYPTARPTSPGSRRTSGDRPRSPNEPQTFTTGRNNDFTIRIERSGPQGSLRTVVLGRPNVGGGNDEVPRLSQFAPPRNADGTQQDRPNITGPMLAQYLLGFMGPGHGVDPLSELLGGVFGPPGRGMTSGVGPEDGRWGDYVFNQQALDQIITQIMENSNAHQPVPATEEAIAKLSREVLELGSPLLEKDCAVCKDQFKLETEDPDEQVVVTLPCQHPFHEPCILPWLKTSATCPVCRYQLVPQPNSHPSGPPGAGSSQSNASSSSGSTNNDIPGGGSGVLHNMFSLFSSQPQHGSSSSSNPSNRNQGRSSTTDSSGGGGQNSSRTRRGSNYDIPGGWGDQID
ncbi:hypothetical protein LXA43DRAFT_189892 [Ganoderma leucocontextum]|nr:hypothetical protein LXA43DRAFT_189892 [Ganoderma leucocontextum]